MDSLFHFLFPVISALAAKVHIKHTIRNIMIAGILTVALDLDHFMGVEFDRALFHNIFVTVLIPIILVILAFGLKTKIYTKGFTILLLIFLSSHLFLDLFTEPGIAVLYPFSNKYYSINFELSVPVISRFTGGGLIVSYLGVGLLAFFIMIILPCLFLDEIIEKMERKHESFLKAIRDLMKS